MEEKRFSLSLSVYILFSTFALLIASGVFLMSCWGSCKFRNSVSASIHELRADVDGSEEIHALISYKQSNLNLTQKQIIDATLGRKISRISSNKRQEHEETQARASFLAATADNGVLVNGVNFTVMDEVYRNREAFYRSYFDMEKRFKIYTYKEGDLPVVHDGPCKDIYTIEGRFIHEMEHGARRFKTMNPGQAHVFFMPFSVTWMVKYTYKPLSYNLSPLKNFVADYVRVVSSKHPYWNRTKGADHFMLACHDWGPHATRGSPELYNTSIRVLCNANSSEGFDPRKDVSLPEIHLYGGKVAPNLASPPEINAPRPILAFFAGGLHGPIRPLLINHWKDRDSDIHVYEYLPKGLDYYSFMLRSRFCLCPSGHEVASPRIVEAIYAECVPVILSENYVLPFSDVLRWESFSVEVKTTDIPRLKDILRSISEEKYMKLRKGLRAIRRHFELNQPPKRFDVFHMILHSIWLRRKHMIVR